MNNFNEAYQNSVELVAKVVAGLGLTDGVEEIKNNLLFSIYLQFMQQAVEATENKAWINKLSTVRSGISFEDFNTIVTEGKLYLEEHDTDQIVVLKNATNKVLQDYIIALAPKLSAEKTIELKKFLQIA